MKKEKKPEDLTMEEIIDEIDTYRAEEQAMEKMLEQVPDSYPGFVHAVLNYTVKSSERFENVKKFIEGHSDALSSDILEFISKQNDFYEDAAYVQEIEGMITWDAKMSEKLQINIISVPGDKISGDAGDANAENDDMSGK